MVKRNARELPRRTYPIDLDGDLAGFHITMSAMRGREVIALMRNEMGEVDAIDLIVERCVEHDMPVDDLRDLDMWMLEQILEKWQTAMAETAVPPTSAEPSP